MTVALAKDVEAFLEEQVRSGVCSDPSELVNALLRSVREQQRSSLLVTPKLENWLLEAADKPASLLLKEDFDSVRERVRTRIGPSGS